MAEKRIDGSADSLLKKVHVAAPCAESWEGMPGGDTVRSCDRCQHKVYNLSEMTAAEAEKLLRETEGRLCVRFYRRSDGTIMTKDCPVSNQVARQRIAGAATAVAATVAFAGSAALMSKPRTELPRWLQWGMNSPEPEHAVVGQITTKSVELPMYSGPTMGTPAPIPTPEPIHVEMGEVAPEPEMGLAVEPEMGNVAEPEPEKIMGKIALPLKASD